MNLRETIKYCLPPIVVDMARMVKIKHLSIKHGKILKRNKELWNKQEGQEGFIIGNGPSLKNVDLKTLKDSPVIVCNDFYTHPEVNNLNIVAYMNLDVKDAWFGKVKEFIPPEKMKKTVFIFSQHDKEKVDRDFSEYKENTYFISHYGFMANKYSRYLDISRTTLGIMNILQAHMIMAEYLGFKKTYLMGFDFSFLASRRKTEIAHFYGDEHRSHIPKDEESFYMERVLNTLRVFEAFQAIDKASSTEYINLGWDSSYLDIFPFAKPEEVIKA